MPFPGDSSKLPDRLNAAFDAIAALGEPEVLFKDDPKAQWGDVEADYFPPAEQTDVAYATREEVDEYYDSGRPEDIKISPRDGGRP